MNRSRTAAWVGLCLLAVTALDARAGLLGETLRYQRLAPTIDTPVNDLNNGNHRVGDGVEIADAFQGTIAIDVLDDGLVLTFRDLGIANRPFVGFSLTDVFDSIDAFTSFSVSSDSSRPFDAGRLRFDADRLWVNLAGMSFERGDRLVFDIGQASSPSPVPEPASVALALLGLAGVGAASRRRAAS